MSDKRALSAAQWAQARELFDQLLAMPLAEQAAALQASGAEDAVQAEVRSLLAHAQADDAAAGGEAFLSSPAEPVRQAAVRLASTDGDPTGGSERTGQRIGPWRITGLLGRGGMGEVWAAERGDGAFEGRAAIKVLKRGMDSQRVLARFAQEQQALARLNHPHIAHLLDAGRTDDGLPYFVMEAVDGLPIDRACADRPLEARLALFLQLAEAVAHAHRHLLVHRDLKPSNVLVNAEGQVKLLDFGIAKALDPLEGADPGTTVAGERPFTPHYASPEQVRGEPVGTATDLYSLGVLLYVMLTGVRPDCRPATSAVEAALSVLEEEPTRPSALSPGLVADPQWMANRRRLAGDLDNILLKALDKRAEHRYASVDALSADLRAHLGGFPVSARAATWGYTARKFVGRNRVAVGLAGLGLAALLGGLGATLWQKREADAARRLAEAQRRVAEQRFAQVRKMANQLVFKYHDQVEYLPGAAKVREALLTDAVAFMDQLRQGGVDDPGLAEELAETYYRISRLQGGDPLVNTGQHTAAEANLDKAIALTARYLPRPEATVQALSRAVSMHVVKAEAWQRRGRMAQADQALRQGLPILERALARDPKDSWALAGAISLHGVHARILGAHPSHAGLGRWREGCAAADRARAAAEATLAADPANVYVPDSVAFTLGEQGQCRLIAGQPEEAVALFRREVALRDQMAATMPDDMGFRWQRAVARGQLARALSLQGQHPQAIQALAEARSLADAALAADPGNAAGRARTQALAVHALAIQLAAGDAGAVRRQADVLLAGPAPGEQATFVAQRPRAEALLWAARAWRAARPDRALALAREAAELLSPSQPEDDNATGRWWRAQAWGEQALALAAKGEASAAGLAASRAMQVWGPVAEVPPLYQAELGPVQRLLPR